MELNLTDNLKNYMLTVEEVRIVELYRTALEKHFADIGLVIHQGKLVSASLTEKFKY